MTEPIEAVVLDLGGVFTASPFPLLEAYAARVGIPPGLLAARLRPDAPLIDRAERGEIALLDYFETVCADLRAEADHNGDAAGLWQCLADSLVPVGGIVELVRAVARTHRLALLTNNTTDLDPIWRARMPVELIDVVVDSSAVGLRKPDPEIYRLTLELLDLPAARTVFVDDQEVNLVPARELGMHTILFRSVEAFRRQLAELGVLPAA